MAPRSRVVHRWGHATERLGDSATVEERSRDRFFRRNYPGWIRAVLRRLSPVGVVHEAGFERVEGPEAIRVVRDMAGATNGRDAAAGTIRGDFSCSRRMNLVHASDGPASVTREVPMFFDKDEVCRVEPTLTPWLRAEDEN